MEKQPQTKYRLIEELESPYEFIRYHVHRRNWRGKWVDITGAKSLKQATEIFNVKIGAIPNIKVHAEK